MNNLLTYIIRRLLLVIPVLLLVSIITFTLIYLLPGDPAIILGGEFATKEELIYIRQKYGLNDPVHIQYYRYLSRILHGDLGVSLVSQRNILEELTIRFPATLELAIFSTVIAIIIGFGTGVISAVARNSIYDFICRTIAITGVSIPAFWLGLILQLILGIRFNILPVSGRGIAPTHITGMYVLDSLLTLNTQTLTSSLLHIILPALVLSMYQLAIISRMVRSSMLDVLRQDYVRTARSKGLPELVVITKHALRNALIPTVTVIGLAFASSLAGSILTETIFAWPGLGLYTYDSILSRDYPVINGVVLFVTVVYALVNLIVDVLYGFLDPRIRLK